MTELYQLGIKGLIRNEQGSILLLQVNVKNLQHNTKGAYWDLPGGRVEEGDDIIETLQREIKEELACDIKGEPKAFFFSVANIKIPWGDRKTGLILSVYECALAEKSTIKISDEHIDYKWFEINEAAEKLAVKYSADFVDRIKAL